MSSYCLHFDPITGVWHWPDPSIPHLGPNLTPPISGQVRLRSDYYIRIQVATITFYSSFPISAKVLLLPKEQVPYMKIRNLESQYLPLEFWTAFWMTITIKIQNMIPFLSIFLNELPRTSDGNFRWIARRNINWFILCSKQWMVM